MATNNMHNLTTLIKRLEAATSRLEDIATTIVDDGTQKPNGTTPSSDKVIAAASSPPPAPSQPEPAPEPLPRSIEDFDKLIEEDVQAFVTASGKVGGLVEEQANAVLQAFKAERTYLLLSTKAKEPKPQPPELMTDLHRHTSAVDQFREDNRPSPLFTHLSAVAEGIFALGWIVEKRPADYVADTLGGAQYYGNKVLKDYKDNDRTHVEYMQAYYKVFRSLIAYVKQYYATGLTWNNQNGVDALEAFKQIQSGRSAPGAAGGAPPPPPPPLPNFDASNGGPPPPPMLSAQTTSKGGDMSSVFDQINQGSSVTSGLKKVDKSEMTHKNPSLRSASTVPERSNSQSSSGRGKSPLPNKKPDNMRTKKPARKELDGTKWILENYDNTGNEIIEIPAELNHSILISRCNKCVVRVTDKANAISIDNCTGLQIVIDSLVSSLDVIKSSKFAVQVDGVLPSIMLTQVDGAQLYLSRQSLGTEVLTSQCSAVNIVLPPSSDADDDKECPLPDQIRTTVRNGALVHEIVEHAG